MTKLKKRLHSIHNAKYTSKAIQNEVLGGLADMVRTKIIEEVKQSEVFSIMADEQCWGRYFKKVIIYSY